MAKKKTTKKEENKEEGVYYKDLSDEELKQMFTASYEAIYVSDCFGVGDIRTMNGTSIELEKRGIEIKVSVRNRVSFKNVKNKNN